ncbi:hypothetical protein C2S51_005164 [Perilla frutescens var. frutescens]|nr:hypothetical protein C2S51_005164 [Perilla frutescens var. frutescens]
MNNNLLQYVIVVAVIASSALLCSSSGRDLRPSDHGLAYQESSSPPRPAATQDGETQEMRSFFGATVELPEAKNISDTWVSAHAGGGRARDAGREHVRLGLVVASAVCGLTGVVLLAISGVVFLFRLRKQGPKVERSSSTSALTSLPQGYAEININ